MVSVAHIGSVGEGIVTLKELPTLSFWYQSERDFHVLLNSRTSNAKASVIGRNGTQCEVWASRFYPVGVVGSENLGEFPLGSVEELPGCENAIDVENDVAELLCVR